MNSIDVTIFQWLNSWTGASSFLDGTIIFCAQYLWYVMIFAALLFPLCSFLPAFREYRQRHLFLFAEVFVSAFFARIIFANLIRFLYDRPRPFEALGAVREIIGRPDSGSFPSGHASLSFAVAAAVSLYYPRAGILFFMAAFFIGIARVAGGVHWPSDILGGAVVGIVTALLINWCFGKYRAEHT